MLSSRTFCFLTAAVGLAWAVPGQAAPIVPGQFISYVDAVQDVTIPVGSPLNPGTDPIPFVGVSATGFFTFDRQQQVGDSIELTNGNFFGTGFEPGLGNFRLFAGADHGLTPMTATISSVFQDEFDPGFATGQASSFLFGDGLFRVPDFGIEILDDMGNVAARLTTRDPFDFEAALFSLDPEINTTFFATEDIDINAFVGTGTDVAAISSNRRLFVTAVPEPTSLSLLSLVGGAAMLRRRRRQKDRSKNRSGITS